MESRRVFFVAQLDLHKLNMLCVVFWWDWRRFDFLLVSLGIKPPCSARLQICPLYIFGNYPPQTVPIAGSKYWWNQGLAAWIFQGQIYNPGQMIEAPKINPDIQIHIHQTIAMCVFSTTALFTPSTDKQHTFSCTTIQPTPFFLKAL